MILGETALSFLGLGMQAPAVSWGTLLRDAQSLQAISQQSWVLMPCIFVIVTVMMFNFLVTDSEMLRIRTGKVTSQ